MLEQDMRICRMLLFTSLMLHGAQVKGMKGVGAGLSSVYRIHPDTTGTLN